MRSHGVHRWTVDGLEEDSARVEEDGARIITIPRYLLPPDVREGEILLVERSDERGDSVRITVTVDEAATRDAMAKSKKQVTETMLASKKNDPGAAAYAQRALAAAKTLPQPADPQQIKDLEGIAAAAKTAKKGK